jgi:hypothetical protein
VLVFRIQLQVLPLCMAVVVVAVQTALVKLVAQPAVAVGVQGVLKVALRGVLVWVLVMLAQPTQVVVAVVLREQLVALMEAMVALV